ncbi:GYD family protein [bacterium I07]|nr:GYD family protein [bacterium I07]
MQTFMLLTKLAPDVIRNVKDRAKMGREWLDMVKKKCPEVTFKMHYALLGEYDFVDIYEAPDEDMAAKVSIIGLAHGAYEAKSLLAIPYKRYLELAEEVLE